ncbi:MAG: glycosyl hydrolase 115 family protein [Prevotella sp.]|nr:glycosyl hydrolase 115 family protein [Prevotella sp.]
MQINKQTIILAFCLLLSALQVNAADGFVSFVSNNDNAKLCKVGEKMTIGVSDNDDIAVTLAAKNLCKDFKAVMGSEPQYLTIDGEAQSAIIAGTIGQSKAIDALVKQGVIDAKQLKGKTEKYVILVNNGKIIVAGSDRRGTVYGIYEISRQIGVSPWYYWMDAPIKKQNAIYVKNGSYTDGEPAVKYRGIFLNDEAPCLTSWVKNTFGTGYGDHNFYEKVFELILRLKGNYLWPAMWGWAFYADDPENITLADQMGVVMGTSHHEPMAKNHQEWARRRNGKWNYQTNQTVIDEFFIDGIKRMKTGGHNGRTAETLVTIGMRGDGDEAMSEDADTKLLERIVKNQRDIIKNITGKPAKETPQVWALYKEVLDYYDKGMRVPDDVIMLLCDDNWGNVRRTPALQASAKKKSAKANAASGGWGLYYHVDYVGAPRNSKTLNVTPTQNMVEQLSLAYNNGIDKLWILNVGDLKPMEYQIQVFMDMAYYGNGIKGFTPSEANPAADNPIIDVMPHTTTFCTSLFGEKEGSEAARILDAVCKLNGRCTPEMLDAKTYNLEAGEWQIVVDEYKTLEVEALRQYANLPAECRDAYFQLILFPVQLMANLHQMYHAQAMNNALNKRGDAAMNEWADKCEMYFKRDAELMRQYNEDVANGKWNGMMTQKHIGYKSWNDNFPHDMLPKLFRTDKIENIFSCEKNTVEGMPCDGYIAIEAEHYNKKTGNWTLIPTMGRTLSAMTTADNAAKKLDGSQSLTYAFELPANIKEVKVHVVTKSTLDYMNKGGMTYSLSIDGGKAATVNFNDNLNEDPKNVYSIYYPTVASRVVEKTVTLPIGEGQGEVHTLKYVPNDPNIVLEKIVIDFGGYKKQYLFGKESKRK